MYFVLAIAAVQAVFASPTPNPDPDPLVELQIARSAVDFAYGFAPQGAQSACLSPTGSTGGHQVQNLNTPSYYPGAPYLRLADSSRPTVCNVSAAPNGGDSAPAILAAFQKCGQNGKINFLDPTYNVKSVMSTTGLCNVEVNIAGNLLWDTNITYWLKNSLPVGYQNQSTAWVVGGDQVWFHAQNGATFNGNGQVWYDYIGAGSNIIGRPHALTFNGLTNSVVEGLRFFQSQMWSTSIIHSNNVLLQDIYVNNTNLKGGYDQNTDGSDTIYSNNITYTRWTVQNGDDSISMKANSTNMLIENCTFHNGGGLAMGSIGQYYGRFETIENITGRDISYFGTVQAAYVKTWTGIQKGYPPNGGGGGLGYVKNITFSNFTVSNMVQPWYITQCISYNGQSGGCDTSKFQIEDLYWSNVNGDLNTNMGANFQCSAAAPCKNINLSGLNVDYRGKPPTNYLCSDVLSYFGFKCTGSAN